jgi:hypothetical protein
MQHAACTQTSDMHFQVRKMIADIDKDDSGTIDFEEFLQMMTAKMVRHGTHSPLVPRGDICASRPGGCVAVGLESRMRRKTGLRVTERRRRALSLSRKLPQAGVGLVRVEIASGAVGV